MANVLMLLLLKSLKEDTDIKIIDAMHVENKPFLKVRSESRSRVLKANY